MSEFPLEIMTPEREFCSGNVEALTVTLPDGQLTVLAGHTPMTAVLAVGELKYKQNGEWRVCFNSEGFIEVRPDKVVVFVQVCEYPEEIDENRAREALERANQRLRGRQNIREHELTHIALTRAMIRLRITRSIKGKK